MKDFFTHAGRPAKEEEGEDEKNKIIIYRHS